MIKRNIFVLAVTGIFLGSCGGGARPVEVELFKGSESKILKKYSNEKVNLAYSEEDCLLSTYHVTATDANGDLFFDRVEEFVPDLSKLADTKGQPDFADVSSALDFRTTINVIDSTKDPALDDVTIAFTGVLKVCSDLFGASTGTKTVTAIFYGSTQVNLNDLSANTHPLCSGKDNCIVITSFATELYPSREGADILSFISSVDKKQFVPLYLYHTGVSCLDDNEADRSSIKISTKVDGLTDPITSTYGGHADDRYHFLVAGAYDATNKKTVLASVLVGQTYEITFTQGSGTGCTPGATKTGTIAVQQSDVFDSNGVRTNESLDLTFNW